MAKAKTSIARQARSAVVKRARKVSKELGGRTEAARAQARQQTVKTAQSVVKLQHKAFDKAFSLIGRLQNQSEKMLKDAVDKSDRLPKEGKAVIDEWIKTLHGGRVKFQQTVDKSFGLVQQFLSRVEAEKPATPAKKAPARKKAAKKRRTRKSKVENAEKIPF
ncbi:MAG TPA: hypothetical protein PLI09_24845 [Candidatus Hydrogenedentes bacterium]|nr:hypothetical protein [Candidatus Hydrogenedentota bacterium]